MAVLDLFICYNVTHLILNVNDVKELIPHTVLSIKSNVNNTISQNSTTWLTHYLPSQTIKDIDLKFWNVDIKL